MAAELFKVSYGTEMVHVPYRSSGQVTQDLLSGQIQVSFDNITIAWPHVEAGKLRSLATTGAKRTMPGLPAMNEFLPGYEVTQWYGILVPAGTPRDIVDRLHREIVKALSIPKIAQLFTNLGTDPVTNSPEEFGAFIRAEGAKWGKVARAAKLPVD